MRDGALSAQTTDVIVNKATPKLFAKYPDAKTLAKAEPDDVEPLVEHARASSGRRRRASSALARALVEQHGGEVPRTLDELVKLPGVGRKTANVVLGVRSDTPEGVVVDTHVQRISQRLGWTRNTEPVKIEQDLMQAPAAQAIGTARATCSSSTAAASASARSRTARTAR